MFLGLRTVTYPCRDLAATKAWFTALLGAAPYFDEPFYVGFNVAGYELGLVPHSDAGGESTTYWGVADADAALERLVAAGGTSHHDVTEVGDGIRVAAIREPGGNIVGIIENPVFDLSTVPVTSAGPGR